ncbi:MAG: hypothetical protein ACKO2N_24020 [Tabrizicola sp.]
MTLRRLHRFTAIALCLFLALHLANHLAGLAGQEAHREVQMFLRQIYRNPVIEALLLTLLALQVGFGLALARQRRRISLQSLAGLYLAGFIVIHLTAVLSARWQGVETDLAFAAAGMHAPQPWPVVFALYYGMAVTALGLHLSAALARRRPALARILAAFGMAIAAVIVLILAGWPNPLTIPPELIAQFPGS